jgi:CheY-like chemotaxis protein
MKYNRYQVSYMTPENNDGFITVRAASEEHAIEIVQSNNPDWIVLDACKL